MCIFNKYHWHIDHFYLVQPGEEYRIGVCNTTGNIGPHFDPQQIGPPFNPNYAINCTAETPSNCELGDLTGKHDTVIVSGEPK